MRSTFSKFVGNGRARVYRTCNELMTRVSKVSLSTAEDMPLMLRIIGKDYHIRIREVNEE